MRLPAFVRNWLYQTRHFRISADGTEYERLWTVFGNVWVKRGIAPDAGDARHRIESPEAVAYVQEHMPDIDANLDTPAS